MPVTNPQKGLPQHPKIEIRSAPLPTLWQRLRQIKKKDLAFILSGLAILVLAPVAQHYLLSPNSEGGGLEPGFSTHEPGGAGDKDVFEPGLGGFAPGSTPGGADVITPLTSRDPSSLLMPPGGPPAPPKVSAADNIRDALNRAMAQGSEKAVASAGLPQPSPRLASTLRGLAALAGAGGNNTAPLPIGGGGSVLQGAHSVPNESAARAYAGPYAPPGFGSGLRGIDSASTDALENLKNAADKAAGHFGGAGPAGSALEAAARDSIHPNAGEGGGGGGGGLDSGNDKSHAGNNYPPGKYELGENLAFELAKMRAQKELDLLYKKREMVELLPYKMMDKLMDLMMDKIVGDGILKAGGECIGGVTKGTFKHCYEDSGPTATYMCYKTDSISSGIPVADDQIINKYPMGANGMVVERCAAGQSKDKDGKCPNSVEKLECTTWVATNNGKAASPTGAAGSGPAKQSQGVRNLYGDTASSLDSLINDPNTPPTIKDAATKFQAAVAKAKGAHDDAAAADSALQLIQARDGAALKNAHQNGLDQMRGQGTVAYAYSNYQTQPSAASKQGLKTVFDPAYQTLAAASSQLAQSQNDIKQSVDKPLQSADGEATEAGQLRDAGDALIKQYLDEKASTDGNVGQKSLDSLKERRKGVNDSINEARGSQIDVSNSATKWEDAVYRSVAPSIQGAVTTGDAVSKALAADAKKEVIKARWDTFSRDVESTHAAIVAVSPDNASVAGGGAPTGGDGQDKPQQ